MNANHAQYEKELFAWASKLDASHVATLRQLAAGSPQEFMRQLAATKLSRGALQVAAATIDQHGFEGAAGLVRGRLEEIATHNRIEHAAQDPGEQQRAAAWLDANGVKLEGNSAVHQAAQIHLAAKARGVHPTAVAQYVARAQNPEAEAQAAAKAAAAEAAKNPALAKSEVQAILALPELHQLAKARGTSGAALLKELVRHATSGDYAEVASEWGEDASVVRELLGAVGSAVALDGLAKRGSERDGDDRHDTIPAPAERSDDGRRADIVGSVASLEKQNPRPPPPKVPDAERVWRGDVSPGRQTAEMTTSRRFDAERAYREHTGQSFGGMKTTRKVAAEVRRDEARALRDKFNAGETRRDDIRSSIQQLDVARRGPEAVAQFEETRRGALELADRIEAGAAESEAA